MSPDTHAGQRHKRKQLLVQPAFQLRLAGRFVGIAVLAMTLQALLLTYLVARAAGEAGPDGAALAQRVPGMMLWVFGVTFVVLVPLMMWLGVVLTHRTAGPLYRLEEFLVGVVDGTEREPMRTRHGDELKELTTLVNTATAPLLRENAAREPEAPASAHRLRAV